MKTLLVASLAIMATAVASKSETQYYVNPATGEWSPSPFAGATVTTNTPPRLPPTDRATDPAHATLYAREWQLIALLYRYSTPETAGVDPTGDAATNYDKLVSYAAGIADISTRMGVMADADRMQFLWVWCERERSKLGVTVGYGERYISQ